ncbi:MAG: 3-deoxy-7-phosphoheptulonate synthase [Gemmatimonadetes bacterium]|jgi:3-deoxy-7-phosphoheptulonate synthase|nr:3-deoxy-7-phosphoheptulonate synthase [Gemmatimonadota bacterium]MBK7785990.1 3-deoxy-7-phosphoheptulonate synthase [Gemmatimonadota bacterium]
MSSLKPIVPETSNLHVTRFEPLVAPRALLAELPITRGVATTVLEGRRAVGRILAGQDRRLLVVVGPCSIHDPVAALEYAGRLAALRRQVASTLELVMRVYFEKPRTTVGWKGLINDPHLDGTRDMMVGLRTARRLLLDINALGLPAATELLGPVVPQYIADLVCWTAIGARTAESQTHREMASGLSMPVGFKNTTDGNLQVALDAMQAAGTPHTFLGMDDDGRGAIVHTTGNPERHLVLRGGGGRTNYDATSVAEASALCAARGLPARVMVDCSHGNSSKDHDRQPVVFENVVAQLAGGSPHLMGAMLESHLLAGSQRLGAGPGELTYGVSITDACIGWERTEALLRAADARLRAATPTPRRATGS